MKKVEKETSVDLTITVQRHRYDILCSSPLTLCDGVCVWLPGLHPIQRQQDDPYPTGLVGWELSDHHRYLLLSFLL